MVEELRTPGLRQNALIGFAGVEGRRTGFLACRVRPRRLLRGVLTCRRHAELDWAPPKNSSTRPSKVTTRPRTFASSGSTGGPSRAPTHGKSKTRHREVASRAIGSLLSTDDVIGVLAALGDSRSFRSRVEGSQLDRQLPDWGGSSAAPDAPQPFPDSVAEQVVTTVDATLWRASSDRPRSRSRRDHGYSSGSRSRAAWVA